MPSCPDCEDCARQACVPRTYFHTDTCGPDGLCKRFPYACGDGGTCAVPGDQCACIASCFACDNCEATACIDPCTPGALIDIVAVNAVGPTCLVAGQSGDARANALLSDGTAIDVTWLATWVSSVPGVATVDPWGHVETVAVGSTDITARLADAGGAPLALTVVERPTLQRILVENLGCQIYAYPTGDPAAEPKPLPPVDAFLPPPYCQQVVRVGGTIQFRAPASSTPATTRTSPTK
ncbi:MAG: hypothetical protein U0802_04125 [Candidatus Binatia bacterium]